MSQEYRDEWEDEEEDYLVEVTYPADQESPDAMNPLERGCLFLFFLLILPVLLYLLYHSFLIAYVLIRALFF